MKLTARSQYALLALIYLGRQDSDRFITIQTIATAQGIPAKFLEQLLLAMKRGKFVQSHKGQQGGYRLAKRPEEISLAEIIRYFDGALSPVQSTSHYFYEAGPIEKEQRLTRVFKELRDIISDRMEKTTLADVI
jgi:Rrf2 family protein